jgi:SWI/SNF chromatin-remodeling complex subunit SWI1
MPLMPDENALVRQNSQSLPATNGQIRPRQQAARRKIEYVPLKREVESYGGRDLRILDHEYQSVASRRPMREVNDWGTLELDWLCMSIRSRLSLELSYALTTFCVISTMRSQTPQTGFPLKDCPDLLEDSLDLVEELAYGEPEKKALSDALDQPRLFTNRELVSYVQDTHGQPFASLRRQQGSKDPNLGPTPRPADLIMLVVDIIRNLTVVDNNLEFLAKHPRAMDIFLRLCCVEQVDGQPPAPSSKALSLVDVLYIRREVVNILVGVGSQMRLSANSTPATHRTTRRMVDLLASYLVDPLEAIPPVESIQMAGVAPNHYRRPSALADTALEAFTKFSTVDENRPIIAQVVPLPTLWLLLERLLRRLPVMDVDFQLMQREPWIAYIEKIIASIYTIIFISPSELKHRIKTDRNLAFKHVMLRVAHRVLQQEGRCGYAGRRAIESIKLLDSNEEATSSDQQTPALSFGMGFEDGGDAGMEKGMGLLGGSRDMAWDMLFMREVLSDDVVFMELDSLQRVDCS